MTTPGALGALSDRPPTRPKESQESVGKCPNCPSTVAGAVHDLLDEMRGLLAKAWLDTPGTVRWFVAAGAPEALERHGWSFWSDAKGACRLERLDVSDGNASLPEMWMRDCLDEDGELTLADAAGSYRAWLIAYRANHPHLYPKEPLTSPPKSMNDDGKRLLRRLGYRVTRKGGGPSRFAGASLKPEAPHAVKAATASDEGDPMAALVALADMVRDPRDLDIGCLRLTGRAGRLCTRCGMLTRRAATHLDCPDVRARYSPSPVTTRWLPGMGGLEEVEE